MSATPSEPPSTEPDREDGDMLMTIRLREWLDTKSWLNQALALLREIDRHGVLSTATQRGAGLFVRAYDAASATPSEPPSPETDLQVMSRCYNETLREYAALRAQNEALRTALRELLADLALVCSYQRLNTARAALQDEQAARPL